MKNKNYSTLTPPKSPCTCSSTTITSISSISTTPPCTPDTATTTGGAKDSSSSRRNLDCTENCPICWEGYKVGEKVCWSMNEECHHAFHFDCMVNWLVDHDHCPLCRSPYLTAKKETKKRESPNPRVNTIRRSTTSRTTSTRWRRAGGGSRNTNSSQRGVSTVNQNRRITGRVTRTR